MSQKRCGYCSSFSKELENGRCPSCSEAGDLQPENYNGDYGPHWQEARATCLHLYHNRCAACLMTNEEHRENPKLFPPQGGLHVHHIKKYWYFDTWDQANAQSNLIPLCATHHRAVEDGRLDVAQWGGLSYEQLLRYAGKEA